MPPIADHEALNRVADNYPPFLLSADEHRRHLRSAAAALGGEVVPQAAETLRTIARDLDENDHDADIIVSAIRETARRGLPKDGLPWTAGVDAMQWTSPEQWTALNDFTGGRLTFDAAPSETVTEADGAMYEMLKWGLLSMDHPDDPSELIYIAPGDWIVRNYENDCIVVPDSLVPEGLRNLPPPHTT